MSESTLNIVDAHHHLWDLSNPNHHYRLLRPETSGDRVAGDFNRLKSTYSIKEYLSDVYPYNIVKSVHIEAGYDVSADPWGDTEWLHEQGKTNDNDLPNGLVVYANMMNDQLRERLSVLTSRFNRVRGVRQMLNWLDNRASKYTACDRPDYLIDDKWKQGFGLLHDHGLSFDLQVYHHQMIDAAQLAREYSNTTIILDHCGKSFFFFNKSLSNCCKTIGLPYDENIRNQWKEGMSILAQQHNVSCKLSGLVMYQHQWTIDSLRPYIEHALNVFGAQRCLFGSNFPVDKLNASFAELIEVYLQIAKETGLSQNEIEHVFHDNAIRVYRL